MEVLYDVCAIQESDEPVTHENGGLMDAVLAE